jgi:hypothetical protein
MLLKARFANYKARFANYVDAIFRRHNMKSIGYWRPKMRRILKTIFRSIPADRKRRRIGLLSKPIRNGRGKGGIGEEREAGGSYRSLLHGSNQLSALK